MTELLVPPEIITALRFLPSFGDHPPEYLSQQYRLEQKNVAYRWGMLSSQCIP